MKKFLIVRMVFGGYGPDQLKAEIKTAPSLKDVLREELKIPAAEEFDIDELSQENGDGRDFIKVYEVLPNDTLDEVYS